MNGTFWALLLLALPASQATFHSSSGLGQHTSSSRVQPTRPCRSAGDGSSSRWVTAAAPAPALPPASRAPTAAAAAAEAAPAQRLARRLRQQRSLACPPGCASDACVFAATSGSYACTRCLPSLTLSATDGTCGCPRGSYAQGSECAPCPRGAWCSGGAFDGAGAPAKVECPGGGTTLTTIGMRATSIRACVNLPGTFFSLDSSSNPTATPCPADSFSSGLRKQRTCTPCPSGLTTGGATGQSRGSACTLAPGFFFSSAGVVAPCAQGEYKAGLGSTTGCTPCAPGVTTQDAASTSEAACTVVLPGYYPAALNGTAVTSARPCPQKFYCAGGVATAAFDPQTPAALNDTTVAACADGTWTQGIGASAASQCMTPPGHKTANGATIACADGEYRAEWKVASQAASCTPCGEGIQSDATDQVTAFAITADATPSAVAVRASAAACYIKAGQGMLYSAASQRYRAANCDTNSHGVANKTYGLAGRPCRPCPYGMQASTSLASSAQYWASDGSTPARQGFTSRLACVTQAGFGFDGRMAPRCRAGSYNAGGNRSNCTQCAPGLSTPDSVDAQVSADNCTIAPGFGSVNGSVQACPAGTHNDALRPDTTSPCTPCSAGLWTSGTGSTSAAACNMCAAGYGGASCSSQCGGGTTATYGPPGQPIDTACQACPAASPAFAFTYLEASEPFTPGVVARAGADSAGDCLASLAQVGGSGWFLGGSASLTAVPGAGSFSACAADCEADARCQYFTYDYAASEPPGAACQKRLNGTTGSQVLAFKAFAAANTSAASSAYSWWPDEDASGVGASRSAGSTASVQACLDACDADAECAAVVLTGLSAASTVSSVPDSCELVRGAISPGKRSMTRAVAARLTLAAVP